MKSCTCTLPHKCTNILKLGLVETSGDEEFERISQLVTQFSYLDLLQSKGITEHMKTTLHFLFPLTWSEVFNEANCVFSSQ